MAARLLTVVVLVSVIATNAYAQIAASHASGGGGAKPAGASVSSSSAPSTSSALRQQQSQQDQQQSLQQQSQTYNTLHSRMTPEQRHDERQDARHKKHLTASANTAPAPHAARLTPVAAAR